MDTTSCIPLSMAQESYLAAQNGDRSIANQLVYSRIPAVVFQDECARLRTAITVVLQSLPQTMAQIQRSHDGSNYIQLMGAANPEEALQVVYDVADTNNWLLEDRQRGFSLNTDCPLLRISALVDTNECINNIIVLSYHEIILDTTAATALVDLILCHATHCGNIIATAIPFEQYIKWESSSADVDAAIKHAETLSAATSTALHSNLIASGGTPPSSTMPATMLELLSFPQQQQQQQQSCSITIPANYTREKTLVKSLVCAAWALVLSRYSFETTVSFGVLHDLREHFLSAQGQEPTSTVIGPLSNVTPLVIECERARKSRGSESGEPDGYTLQQWIDAVQTKLETAERHSFYARRSPVHQHSQRRPFLHHTAVVVSYRCSSNADQTACYASQLLNDIGILVRCELDSGDRKLWVQLQCMRGSLSLGDTNFYLACDMLNRLSIQFANVLQWFARHIDSSTVERVALAPLINEDEQAAIVKQCSCDLDNYDTTPLEECIHEAFERQVRQCPDAIALTFRDKSMTYQQLDQQANRVAEALLEIDAGIRAKLASDTGVDDTTSKTPFLYTACVLISKSLELPIAALGCLKAGVTYVPLDTMMKFDRISVIFKDAKVKVALTEAQFRDMFEKEHPDVTIICIEELLRSDRFATDTTSTSSVAARRPNKGDYNGISHILYTSGSTGQPKGAMLTHINHTCFVRSMQKRLGYDHNDTWALYAAVTFDASQMELWCPLLCGCRLVIVPAETRINAHEFRELILSEGINIFFQTPISWRNLVLAEEIALREGKPLCTCIKHLLVGGETMDFVTLRRWHALYSSANKTMPQVTNVYGLTETTIVNVVHTYTEEEIVDSSNINNNVGCPIPEVSSIYLLDENMRPVPYYSSGEIYLGGLLIGAGFVETNPESKKHNVRFVSNPFSTHRNNARLYRTGDIGWLLPNGDCIVRGRLDTQIKIGGNRVEIEEIENVMNKFPNVKLAVVHVRRSKDAPHSPPVLVAFVSPISADKPIDLNQLKLFTASKLPEHMVPREFFAVSNIPLSTNGKINRLGLAELDVSTRAAAAAAAASTAEAPKPDVDIGLQMKLIGVVTGVLQLEKPVDPHDNILYLTEHRHPLTQLARITKLVVVFHQYGLTQITSRLIFDNPTVAQLCRALKQQGAQQGHAAARELQASDLIETKVLRIFKEALNVSEIGPEDNFFLLGGNSILAMHLMNRVQSAFDNVKLPFSTIIQHPTARALAQVVREASRKDPSRIVLLKKGTSEPVFFFHPAFRSALCYVPLSFCLDSNLTMYGLEESEFRAYTSMEELAQEYAKELLAFYPCGEHGEDRPFHFVGYSFGGTIAVEVARVMEQQHGRRVATLIVLDEPRPVPHSHLSRGRPLLTIIEADNSITPMTTTTPSPEAEAEAVAVAAAAAAAEKDRIDAKVKACMTVAVHVAQLFGRRVEQCKIDESMLRPVIHDNDKILGVFVNAFAEMMPEHLCRFYVSRFIGDIVNTLDICFYEPTYKLQHTKIHLFRAEEKSEGEYSATNPIVAEPAMGWDALSVHPVQVLVTPGNHDTMIFPPHAAALGAQLMKLLPSSSSSSSNTKPQQ